MEENTIRGSAVYRGIRERQIELQEQFLAHQLLVIGASRRLDDLREETSQLRQRCVQDDNPEAPDEKPAVQVSARNRHALREEIKKTLQQRRAIEAELTHVGALLSRAVIDRERMARRIPGESDTYSEYQRIQQQREARVEEFERLSNDCELRANGRRRLLKDRPHQRLLRHLESRKFGTSDYRAGSLRTWIDALLAKWCDFATYRAILDGRDEESRSDVERIRLLKEKVEALGQRVCRLEATMAKELGLNQLLEHGRELGARRRELLTQMRHLDRILEKHVEKAARSVEDGENTRPQALSAQTAQPGEPEHRLLTLETVIATAQAELKQRCAESLSLGKQLVYLSQLQTDFLEKDFESARSRFDTDFDLTALIGEAQGESVESKSLAAFQHFVGSGKHISNPGASSSRPQWETSFSAGGGY